MVLNYSSMNDAHLHLIVNHFPVVAPVLGLLVFIAGYATRSAVIKRVACALFIIGAVAALAAGATGERAEEATEHLPGFSHQLIHEHEEAAEIFIISSYILGFTAALGLWVNYKKYRLTALVNLIIVVCAIVTIVLSARAGTTGGEIRHTEIRGE
jgi:uncharacterized membrane protein